MSVPFWESSIVVIGICSDKSAECVLVHGLINVDVTPRRLSVRSLYWIGTCNMNGKKVPFRVRGHQHESWRYRNSLLSVIKSWTNSCDGPKSSHCRNLDNPFADFAAADGINFLVIDIGKFPKKCRMSNSQLLNNRSLHFWTRRKYIDSEECWLIHFILTKMLIKFCWNCSNLLNSVTFNFHLTLAKHYHCVSFLRISRGFLKNSWWKW